MYYKNNSIGNIVSWQAENAITLGAAAKAIPKEARHSPMYLVAWVGDDGEVCLEFKGGSDALKAIAHHADVVAARTRFEEMVGAIGLPKHLGLFALATSRQMRLM